MASCSRRSPLDHVFWTGQWLPSSSCGYGQLLQIFSIIADYCINFDILGWVLSELTWTLNDSWWLFMGLLTSKRAQGEALTTDLPANGLSTPVRAERQLDSAYFKWVMWTILMLWLPHIWITTSIYHKRFKSFKNCLGFTPSNAHEAG